MPYGGVMWVALPVACKKKEDWLRRRARSRDDDLFHIPMTHSLTHTHTHPRIQEKLYTQHIPA